MTIPGPVLPGEKPAGLGFEELGSRRAGGSRGTAQVCLRGGSRKCERRGCSDERLLGVEEALPCGKNGPFSCTAPLEKDSTVGTGEAVVKVEREGGIFETPGVVGTQSWRTERLPGPLRGPIGGNTAPKGKLRMLTAGEVSCGGTMGQGPRRGIRKAGATRASVPYPT